MPNKRKKLQGITKKVELVRTRTQEKGVRMTVLRHRDGHQKDKGREGDKRPLNGEGLLRKKQGRMENLDCS